MMEWQPIETAPKDGTRILAWVVPDNYPDGAYAGVVEWLPTKFRWDCENWPTFVDREVPTHWMPLPDPPETE